ncbi:PREDICTED: methyltransferase-like protein 22 isoform X3 [Chinchilla lanigera]|uniref:methyltransferase-like protein 22 isoform X3 n=1 Tax=Chinchilla lanigera TaxID=34839 RepID=UPI000696E890|nr:PREDICTED: methyltransferase-like protein 22 isoform X3 [Chinchilla lanigera]
MWDSTMDEVTFRSDTVLSDVHLYTPNHRHLMVRLNGVGQPVFLSQFKLLWSQDSWMDSGAEGGDHRHVPTQEAPPAGSCGPGSPPGPGYSHEGCSLQARADSTDQEGAGAQLDEDGDLDVVRRPRASSDTDPAKPPRDKVHPTILTQEEEDVLEDEATGSCPQSIIKIGVAGCPAPGRLHPVPAGSLPGTHCAGARGGHRVCQHRGSHHGTHRLLYRCRRRPPGHVPAKHYPQQPPGSRWRWYREGQGAGLAKGQPVHSQLWTWSQCAGQRPAWQCLLRQAASNPFSCPETSLGQTLGEAWWPAEKGLGPSVASPADPEVPFSWSEEDISDLYDHTTVLFAAEVFYDDSLTDALFRTLHRLTRRLKNACTALLSVERRFNFTLRHLDVTCEAYDHFRSSLHALEKLSDSKLRFVVEPVEASFPQLLIYERIRQLELWKIIAEPTA